MNHLLPDVPLIVVIAHFLALGALFVPPALRAVRRWQLKRQLAESPKRTFGTTAFRSLQPAGPRSSAPLKTR